MGWKVVEVRTDEYIQLYLNNLLIKRNNEKILINLSDIDTLMIENDRATVSIKLLNALARGNINVIFMDAFHEPSAYLVPINGHHNSLKVLQDQINWTNQYKGNCWKEVIKNKLFNQLKMMEKNDLAFNKKEFNKLINDVSEFDVSNREGHGAKVYWHSLFGLDFIRDQKALQNSTINSMLNYGYSILRSLVIKSIVKKGLDSRISFFHKSFTNFYALASDVMEPFRPIIDNIVFSKKDNAIFDYETKEMLLDIWEVRVLIDGKRFFLNQAVDKVVDGIKNGQGWIWIDLWD